MVRQVLSLDLGAPTIHWHGWVSMGTELYWDEHNVEVEPGPVDMGQQCLQLPCCKTLRGGENNLAGPSSITKMAWI